MKRNEVIIICFFIFLWLVGQPTLGNEMDKTISFTLDNDTVFGTDRCFTGGFRLSWIASELKRFKESSWLNWIPIRKKSEMRHFLSFSLGQNVYTPDDIIKSELKIDDRPYAGYLYLTAAFHSISQKDCNSFEISLGIVGPHAYAEETQSFVHKVIGGVEPQGWHNQLKDELILQLFYDKSWKIKPSGKNKDLNIELIPSLGAGLGNAIISGNLGMFFRFGWNIPDDFGMPIKRPSGLKGVMIGKKIPLGIYGFISGDAFLNIRNIFLDGNTLVESHSVNKYLFSGDVTFGVAIQVSGFQIAYTYTFWTKRFETESRLQRYASLNIAYTY